jgi:hypothetical protein
MAGNNGYPIEMYHPSGVKTMLAYDADDQKTIQASFQEWRDTHNEWTQRSKDEAAGLPPAPFSGTPKMISKMEGKPNGQ